MQYIKLKSSGSSVSFLQELLRKIGYDTPSSGYFGVETEVAVKDFQSKNLLVVDGEVGIKTWTLLFDKTKPADVFGGVFLGEQDLIDFANRYQVDLAAVKAVNEVESSGKGFFIDGRPKILFEGHIFWRQLKARGVNPEDFANSSNENVLYKSYNKKHYLGGSREYERLEQAASISSDLNTLFFASNRDGGKGFDDIYFLREIKPLQTECIQQANGVVRDSKTKKVIPGATVTLINDQNETLGTLQSDEDGAFDFGDIECEKTYTARATQIAYSIPEQILESSAEPDLELNLDMALTPIDKAPSIAIGTDLTEILGIENINFDYDKSFIRTDASIELQKVITYMKKYPTVRIDVRSHTDARGSDSYNLSLSKRRNTATKEYIINVGGIDAKRISGKGYGETRLINECANGVKCPDELHEQNRRSEFIVVQK